MSVAKTCVPPSVNAAKKWCTGSSKFEVYGISIDLRISSTLTSPPEAAPSLSGGHSGNGMATPAGKTFAWDEVAQHNSVSAGVWVVIDGLVYDVTQFVDEVREAALC